MNNQGITGENIKLSLPINAAYVSSARLTASSIANRMAFDIDEIEDIKAAVSEACTYVIKNMPIGIKTDFTITFTLGDGVLKISIGAKGAIPLETLDEEMGLVMIRALMDEFIITNNQDDSFILAMVKRHKELSFE